MGFLLTILFLPTFSWAGVENLIEVNMAGLRQAEKEPVARDQITREVLEKTAQRYIIDLIGQKKFETNQQTVRNIIKQVDKFVPFVKGGELKKTTEGFQMSVNLRISLTSLNQLLTKEGLLY